MKKKNFNTRPTSGVVKGYARGRSLVKEAFMEIKIKKTPIKNRKAKPVDEAKLGFGKVFTDHFFNVKYKEGKGWYDPIIEQNI